MLIEERKKKLKSFNLGYQIVRGISFSKRTMAPVCNVIFRLRTLYWSGHGIDMTTIVIEMVISPSSS